MQLPSLSTSFFLAHHILLSFYFELINMPHCPADCGRWFDHDRGLNSHLNQARSCMWYRSYQKTAAIESFATQLDKEDLGEEFMAREIGDAGDQLPPEISDREAGELLQEIEEENDIFSFVPMEEDVLVGQAGPGPATQAHRASLANRQLGAQVRTFGAEDLKMFDVEHPTAGACIRMDESLHERWRESHDFSGDISMDGTSGSKPNIYAPFASEMDWRIADWVVKDNIGHNSLNRLLAIPGVSVLCSFSILNVDNLKGRRETWLILQEHSRHSQMCRFYPS